MGKFASGRFSMKNPDKYVGGRTPLYRSSWEFAFMKFCDESPSISKWASESIKIPYRHPFTGQYTIYVPDFFIAYVDKKGKPKKPPEFLINTFTSSKLRLSAFDVSTKFVFKYPPK